MFNEDEENGNLNETDNSGNPEGLSQEEILINSVLSGILPDEEKKPVIEEGKIEKSPVVKPEVTFDDMTPEQLKGKTIIVDGQRLTFEELQKGYLRQSDYTKKTQALADDRQKMAPYLVLNEHLTASPEMREKVLNLLKTDSTKKEEPPEPEDPLEALEHSATRNALKAIEAPLAGIGQQMAALSKQQRIIQVMAVVETDPLKDATKNGIASYVFGPYQQMNGEEAAQQLMAQLDDDPETFVKYYTNVRNILVENQKAGKKPPEGKAAQEKGKAIPAKVEKKMPFVQDGGQETGAEPDPEKVKRRDLMKMQKKAIGGKTEDVIRFLEVSGLVDHLTN